MAITQIDGLRQIQDESIKRELLELDFLKGSNLNLTGGNNDATLSGLAAGTAPNDAVNKAQLDALALGGMTYRGQLDASDATGAALDGASTGDFWYISTAGVLDGIDFEIGDHLVVNAPITDFDVDGAGKIDKIDNTESSDILRDSDIVNDLTTGGTTSVLSAQQGVVLKGLVDDNAADIATNVSDIATNTGNIATNTGNIATNTSDIATNTSDIAANTGNISTNAANIATNTSNISTNTANIATNTSDITALQADLADRVFGEEFEPVVTTNVYTVANSPIDTGTLRVYINGIRQRVGASNDYIVNEATGLITFADNLKANKDVVVVDYEY